MFQVVMCSWGDTRRVFMSGFETYEQVREMCDYYDWICDDGGYIWDLEIEETNDQ